MRFILGSDCMEKQKSIVEIKEEKFYQEIDPDTGELVGDVISANVIVKQIPRTGFAITYLASIINMIESIGNKKMQVVKYILQNMDSNNKLSETVREIAKGVGCSIQTVQETLALLQSVGIIARKTGTVMLSPKLVHKGNAKRERFLMTKFFAIKDSDENDENEDN